MSERFHRVTEAQVRRELMRENDSASRRRRRVGATVVLCLALLAGMAAARWLTTLADIRSDAMADALRPGDVALCLRPGLPLPGGLAEWGRGDAVLVGYAMSGLRREAVRRVIAVAGDEVSVGIDGRVTLNGEALDEPYALYRTDVGALAEAEPGGALGNPFADTEEPAEPEEPARAGGVSYPLTIPEGQLFVLCDDRANTLDSRDEGFGLVSEADIEGVARMIVWPAHRAGRAVE